MLNILTAEDSYGLRSICRESGKRKKKSRKYLIMMTINWTRSIALN